MSIHHDQLVTSSSFYVGETDSIRQRLKWEIWCRLSILVSIIIFLPFIKLSHISYIYYFQLFRQHRQSPPQSKSDNDDHDKNDQMKVGKCLIVKLDNKVRKIS